MEKSICLSSGRTQASISWIPWDLWPQILCFLPVRSLLVFRSVCKSFLSIINDPEFISLQFRSIPENALETRFLTHKLIHSKEEVVYEVREIDHLYTSSPATWNNKIIDRVMKPGIPTMIAPYRVPSHWNVKCSLDGLLLLTDNYSTSAVLWNPSIKKHCQLSLPSKRCLTYGLGHDSSSNDYELVAFDVFYNRGWVYSVKTDTWTEILVNNRFGDVLEVGDAYYHSRSFSLKNRVFWIEHYHRTAYKLLRFDFETKRFGYAEMPYSADEITHGGGLVFLDCGSSVGVWWEDVDDRVLVWVLETDTMSWTLRYKIVPPHGFQRSGSRYDMTFDTRLEERNGELMWKHWDASGRELSVESYDIDVETQVYHIKFRGGVQNCLDIYFESLVMLK